MPSKALSKSITERILVKFSSRTRSARESRSFITRRSPVRVRREFRTFGDAVGPALHDALVARVKARGFLAVAASSPSWRSRLRTAPLRRN